MTYKARNGFAVLQNVELTLVFFLSFVTNVTKIERKFFENLGTAGC